MPFPKVGGPTGEPEGLWQIAKWLSVDGANDREIHQALGLLGVYPQVKEERGIKAE